MKRKEKCRLLVCFCSGVVFVLLFFVFTYPPPQLSVGSKFYTQHKVNSWIFLVIYSLVCSLTKNLRSLSLYCLFFSSQLSTVYGRTNEPLPPFFLNFFLWRVCVWQWHTRNKDVWQDYSLAGWLSVQARQKWKINRAAATAVVGSQAVRSCLKIKGKLFVVNAMLPNFTETKCGHGDGFFLPFVFGRSTRRRDDADEQAVVPRMNCPLYLWFLFPHTQIELSSFFFLVLLVPF